MARASDGDEPASALMSSSAGRSGRTYRAAVLIAAPIFDELRRPKGPAVARQLQPSRGVELLLHRRDERGDSVGPLPPSAASRRAIRAISRSTPRTSAVPRALVRQVRDPRREATGSPDRSRCLCGDRAPDRGPGRRRPFGRQRPRRADRARPAAAGAATPVRSANRDRRAASSVCSMVSSASAPAATARSRAAWTTRRPD